MRIETIHLTEGLEHVTLTAYILDDSMEMLKGRKRPAVLICPGGAYMFCSDREAEPAAAVLGYGIYDFARFKEIAKNSANPMDYELFKSSCYAYMGNSEPDEEALIRVSPDRLVTKDTPPMFLWATYEDTTVPVRNTFWMADALAEAGVAVEVHVYEKGGHGFSVADQSSAEAMEQVSPDIAGWVACAQRWLLQRFALKR